MIIIGGRRIYGKVEQVGSTFIATTFAFVQYLPLFPTQSHIVVGEGSPGSWQVVNIKLHGKSILAGYLRAWGIFFTMCAVFGGLIVMGSYPELAHWWVSAGVAFGAAALATASFQLLGRLSLADKAMRLIYARFVGHPVDVEVFEEDVRGRMAKRIRELLEGKSSSVWTASGYRQAAPADMGYKSLALEPSVKDQEYLEAALTLARIEASLAVGSQRAELMRVHRKIWAKLLAEYPDVLGVVRDAQLVEGSAVRRGMGFVPLLLLGLLLGGMLYKKVERIAESERSHLRGELRFLDRYSARAQINRAARAVVDHARRSADDEGSMSE